MFLRCLKEISVGKDPPGGGWWERASKRTSVFESVQLHTALFLALGRCSQQMSAVRRKARYGLYIQDICSERKYLMCFSLAGRKKLTDNT